MKEFTFQSLISHWEQFLQEYCRNDIDRALMNYPDVKSIVINYWDIDRFDTELAEFALSKPDMFIHAGEKAVELCAASEKKVRLHVRLMNLPERVRIRNIRSEHLGKMIAIEGLVRKATDVRPKITEASFECVLCKSVQIVHQDESTLIEPLACEGCNRKTRFKLLTDKSTFVDTQKLEMQESPEGLRGGEQPQRLTAYLDEDLTGKTSPGDRIIVNGILRQREKQMGNTKLTLFEIFIDANSVEFQEREFVELKITEEEEEQIKELSKDPQIYEKIVGSIAPTIYGLENEKEALMLQLFGGVSKRMPDDTRIRGDMHILMVGDPGVAKSQLLRYVSKLAPRGIYASGKSSSAAGLTATAVRDTEFGEGRWTLEAGALVLADGGTACVDEIDKMRSEDSSAMHEALEQQTISVAKAGITATLQCRCSLLGAANPKFGRFDPVMPIGEQIDLPPALLSRFDLIFTLTDKPEKQADTRLANHILSTHLIGEINKLREDERGQEYESEEYENLAKQVMPSIEADLLRKYVAYSRRYCHPVMTKAAIDVLQEIYVDIRQQSEGGSVSITARQLEALVRLAESSSRIRLADKIIKEDAERAIRLVRYCLSRVGIDAETGKFDIDMIASGTTHSQRERLVSVLEIVKELSSAHPEGVPFGEIVHETDRRGMSEERVREVINRMKIDGTLYEPRNERYKLSRE